MESGEHLPSPYGDDAEPAAVEYRPPQLPRIEQVQRETELSDKLGRIEANILHGKLGQKLGIAMTLVGALESGLSQIGDNTTSLAGLIIAAVGSITYLVGLARKRATLNEMSPRPSDTSQADKQAQSPLERGPYD